MYKYTTFKKDSFILLSMFNIFSLIISVLFLVVSVSPVRLIALFRLCCNVMLPLFSSLLTRAANSARQPKICHAVSMEIPEFFSVLLIIKKKIEVAGSVFIRDGSQMS